MPDFFTRRIPICTLEGSKICYLFMEANLIVDRLPSFINVVMCFNKFLDPSIEYIVILLLL